MVVGRVMFNTFNTKVRTKETIYSNGILRVTLVDFAVVGSQNQQNTSVNHHISLKTPRYLVVLTFGLHFLGLNQLFSL